MKLKTALGDILNQSELELISGSYDIIGNIAILEIDKKLKSKEKLIGESLIRLNKNIHTVLKKEGAHTGKYRLQKYDYITGDKKTLTGYKENNCKFFLDISQVYFSPRLSNERLRISNLIKKGEEILVMFSGIGIYPIIISKNSKAKSIYGVEFNKKAHDFARKNISLNLVSNVYVYCVDAKKFNLNKKFDRIIMPLPEKGKEYLNIARKFIKKEGVIHLYTFSSEENIINIKKIISKSFKNFKILNIVKCGNFSPGVYRYCVDFKIK